HAEGAGVHARAALTFLPPGRRAARITVLRRLVTRGLALGRRSRSGGLDDRGGTGASYGPGGSVGCGAHPLLGSSLTRCLAADFRQVDPDCRPGSVHDDKAEEERLVRSRYVGPVVRVEPELITAYVISARR